MPQMFGKFDHMRFRDLRKHLDSWTEKTEELFQRRLVRELFPNCGGKRPIRMIGVGFPDLRYGQGPDLRGHLAGDFHVGGDYLRIGCLDDRKQFPRSRALRIASS